MGYKHLSWNCNSCNEAFIIDDAKREDLIEQDPKSAEIIKPVLRGKDIKRYHAKWNGLYIISTFPALNLNIDDYPGVKNYLIEFGKDRLEQVGKTLADGTKSRKKTRNEWFETQDQIAYYSEFDKEKVAYPETTHSANFIYDKGHYFLEKTCFMITGSNLKVIVGLLSSTLLTFTYKRFCSGTVLGARGYQYNKHALEKLPVVKIPASQQQSFIALVDQILDAKQTNSDADTSSLENEIDTLVYELYNLTEDEIAIVEGV